MNGKNVKELRERTHLPQQALARIIGVSTTTVHRWEAKPSERIAGTGGAIVFLEALDRASLQDPEIIRHVSDWEMRGQFYFWARIFKLASEQIEKRS